MITLDSSLEANFEDRFQALINHGYKFEHQEISDSFGDAYLIFSKYDFMVEITKDRLFFSLIIKDKNSTLRFSINQYSRFLNEQIVLMEETSLIPMIDYLLSHEEKLVFTLANSNQRQKFKDFLDKELKVFHEKYRKLGLFGKEE